MSNFEFSAPLWWLLLPLPLLVYRLIPAYRTRQKAVRVPFFNDVLDVLHLSSTTGAKQLRSTWWQRGLLMIAWFCLVAALANPTLLGPVQYKESIGRDLMVAVDLSGSMAEEDFTSQAGLPVSRLTAAKEVLSEFVSERQGDRLGLILFGNAAFVQTPLTADHQVWLSLLEQTDVAMAGQSTHLGDAIGLAIKVFEQQTKEVDEQVLIVLTDGNDTGSFVEPIEAAKVAKAKGIRIHMIAMGDPTTIGESALDMTTIERVASESGGQAFIALNRQQLVQAYTLISQLEPQLYESIRYQPKYSIYHYFVIVMVLLYLIAFAVVTGHQYYCLIQKKFVQEGGKHV